jgi:hypothetical protein
LSLLGHVDVVVASPGPLAWDAARTGVPVLAPSRHPIPAEQARRRLARLVPSALARNPGFWHSIGNDLVEARYGDWRTDEWVLRARALREACSERPSRLRRKFRKFQRDPHKFWLDSTLGAWAARVRDE